MHTCERQGAFETELEEEQVTEGQRPLFGVGRLVRIGDDPRLLQTQAATYAMRFLRGLSRRYRCDLDPLHITSAAERLSAPYASTHELQLYIMPMPPSIEVDPAWIAVFATSTPQWKFGRKPLVATTDKLVDQVLQRLPHDPDTLEFNRSEMLVETWPRFFAYQVFVRRLGS